LPLAAISDNWAATVSVGADVAEAMAKFAQGDYQSSFSGLFRTRGSWQLLGGSHAQRDIFELTLLHSAVLSGEIGAATAIASERLCQRPNDGSTWWAYGAILAKAGYNSKAADAFNRAYLLGVQG
jgi:Flp pilus assembly protein TadD